MTCLPALRRLSRLAAAGVPALVVVSLTATPASAATTLGTTDFASVGTCSGTVTYVQSSPPAGTTYVAATAGVITQWKFHASFEMQVELKVLHLVSGSDFEVVASSETGTAAANATTTFNTRLPVSAGDTVGISSGSGYCGYAPSSGALTYYTSSDVGAGQTATFSPAPTSAIPVSATLEADVDGDGYGDETQDLCATQPSTQGACDLDPPQTRVTKGPQPTFRTTVRFTFVSDEPGGTFECRFKNRTVHDHQKYTPCSSPMTYKHLRVGKYRFQARAIDVVGNRDRTPDHWNFTVKAR